MASAHRNKVIFIMGATGSGKTRLSLDIAGHFPAEIINSDKIQVYGGLDILTNKIPKSQRRGVPHHLLGGVHPDADFTAEDFCQSTLAAIKIIVEAGNIPIVVGGSNNYIRTLVEDPQYAFMSRYDCCFISIFLDIQVHRARVARRVDEMMEAGLLHELRSMYTPPLDCSRGIWRAIGVPEMERYLKAEREGAPTHQLKVLLETAVQDVKDNTCDLVSCQLENIKALKECRGWPINFINATTTINGTREGTKNAWDDVVLMPSLLIINEFLEEPFKVNNLRVPANTLDNEEIGFTICVK